MKKFCAILAMLLLPTLLVAQVQEPFATFLLNQGTAVAINNSDFLYILQSGVSAKLPGNIMRNPTLDSVNCGQAGVSTCQYNFTAFGGATNAIRLGGSAGILFAQGTINGANSFTFPLTSGLPGQLMTSVGNPNGLGNTPMQWTSPVSPGNIAGRFGSMDVWQRGAGNNAVIGVGLANTGAYTVDGCYLGVSAGQGSTVSSVPGIGTVSYRAAAIQRNAGQAGIPTETFGCPLDTDEIALMRGSFVAISITFSTGANWSAPSITFFLECGTGTPVKFFLGTYTGPTVVASTTITTTPNMAAQRIQATSAAVVPANCTQAEPAIQWAPVGTAGASDLITVDNLQIDVVTSANSVANQFQYVDFNTQLLKAERHFWKSFPYATAPASNLGVTTNEFVFAAGTAGANNEFFYIVSPTSMRATPAITLFNPGAANAQIRNETRGADLTASTSFQISDRAFGIAGTGTAATGVGDVLGIQFTVDAGI